MFLRQASCVDDMVTEFVTGTLKMYVWGKHVFGCQGRKEGTQGPVWMRISGFECKIDYGKTSIPNLDAWAGSADLGLQIISQLLQTLETSLRYAVIWIVSNLGVGSFGCNAAKGQIFHGLRIRRAQTLCPRPHSVLALSFRVAPCH